MRKRYFGKLLSLALSATLAFTSVIPAHAADFDIGDEDVEIAVESDEDFMAEEDAGAEEATEEALEVTEDVEVAEEGGFDAITPVPRNMHINPDANYTGSTIGAANQAFFTYGLDVVKSGQTATKYTFYALSDPKADDGDGSPAPAAAHTDVAWSIYKVKKTKDDTGLPLSDADLIKTDNLDGDATSDIASYGLAVSSEDDVFTLKIGSAGWPTKAGELTYVLEVKDTGDDRDPDNIKRLPISVKILGATATALPNPIADNTATGFDYWSGAAHTVSMGYEVLPHDTSAAVLAKKEAGSYVLDKEITLSTADAFVTDGHKITDLTYEWTGPDKDAFTIVSKETKGLYATGDVKLVVAPVAGLASYGDKAGKLGDGTPVEKDGKYQAQLKVSSSCFEAPLYISVDFVVATNLKVSSVIAHGGKDVVKTTGDVYVIGTPLANPKTEGFYEKSRTSTYVSSNDTTVDAGKTYYAKKTGYDLGKFKVGENLNDVVITGTGGSGTISFTKTGGVLATGIYGDAVNGTGTAQYKLSNMVDTSVAATDYSFMLKLVDSDGAIIDDIAFKYLVVGADVTATIAGEKVEIGKNTNRLAWYAVTGYTAADYAKTVEITNNSGSKITVNAALTLMKEWDPTASSGSGAYVVSTDAFSLNKNSVEIEAGKKGTIVVTPAAPNANSSPVRDFTATLTLSGAGIDTTAIDLAFKENAQNVVITTPADPASGTATITDGSVGRDYSYQFGVTKNSTVKSVEWTVTGLRDMGDSANLVSPSTITDLTKLTSVYGLALNKTTGALTGVPKKVTSADGLEITVTATDAALGTNTDSKAVIIKIKAAKDALAVTVDGKQVEIVNDSADLGADNVIDFGKVNIDEIDKLSKTITISNQTKNDMTAVKGAATTTTIPGGADVVAGTGFEINYDKDNTTINTALAGTGLEIKSGESKVVYLDTKTFNKKTINKGKYEITVAITTDTNSGAKAYFTAKLEVVSVPVIDATYVETLNYYVVGKTYAKTASGTVLAGKAYGISANYTEDPTSSHYTYEWTKGSIPGLELAADGTVIGQPTTAGEYEVTVKATHKEDSTIFGTLTHKITIAGSSTIKVAYGNSTDFMDGTHDTLVLPGMVIGDANDTKVTLRVVANGENAENVAITVEDADDNRAAADILKDSKNPYTGSTTYLDVDSASKSISAIATTDKKDIKIVTKGSPAPGVYKVKITITAKNANPVSFYAIMAVVEKFALTKPSNVNTRIGTDHDDDPIELVTTGGGVGQTITWTETGTKVISGASEVTKYYVTASGSANSTGETGLGLKSAAGAITATTNRKTTIENTITKAGNFEVNIKAKVGAIGHAAAAAAKGYETLGLGSAAFKDVSNSAAFPEQESTATFTIASKKTDKVTVSAVAETGPPATPRGTVEGLKNGNVYVTRTGYTYKPVVTYTNTAMATEITINNDSGMSLAGGYKAEFGENTKFDIVAGGTGAPLATGDIATAIKIQPKANLEKGTYKETLVISGDEFETVNFVVTFTVEDSTYIATIDNGIEEEDTAKANKRVAYVTKNTATSNAIVLDNFYQGATATSDNIMIRQAGNTALANLRVYEVKADGSEYGDGQESLKRLTITAIAADSNPVSYVDGVTKQAGAYYNIEAKQTKAGIYDAKLKVEFTEGSAANAAKKSFIIPVSYTIYSADVEDFTVTPSTATTKTAVEGYDPATLATTFTVQNNSANATGTISDLKVASSNELFDITPAVDPLKPVNLGAKSSKTYTLKPKKGLSEGEYTTTVTVIGDNITPVSRDVVLKVTASTSYAMDVTTNAANITKITDTAVKKLDATRLYNSLVYGLGRDTRTNNTNPKITNNKTASGTNVVSIDFDGTTGNDIKITFSGTDGSGDLLSDVTSATVEILPTTKTVIDPYQTITLGAADIEEARTGIGHVNAVGSTPEKDAKYFTTITFNFYATITFGTTGSTVYAEKKDDLDNDSVVAEAYADGGTGTTDPRANGTVTATVPYGSTIGSVFTSGKLPTAVLPGKSMTAWRDTLSNIVGANDVVSADATVSNIDWHNHKYASVTSTDPNQVKWIWTKDEKGNLSAEVHLYCINGCPDADKGEIVINDKVKAATTIILDADATAGFQPLLYGPRKEEKADCEHGAHYEYTATAKIHDTGNDVNKIYVGKYIEDEQGTGLGHDYDLTADAIIKWNDINNDDIATVDEVSVTRKCTRDANHVAELQITGIGEKDKVEATCTKDGSVQYTVKYMEITETGAKAGEVEKDIPNGKVVLKKKGHSEELLAEVEGFDEETFIAKKLTLTCPDCNEVLFEGTNIQFTDNEDGTYSYKALIVLTGEYYNVSYTTHAHVWTGEWAWATDYKSATLTITCNEGKKPEVKKFTVDAVESTKGALHIFTVEKVYTWTEKGVAKTVTFADSKQIVKTEDGQEIRDIEVVDETQGIYIQGLEAEYPYTGNPIQPKFYVIDASEGLRYLAKGVDYTVTFKNNKNVGKAEVIVKGKGNYSGQSQNASFAIVDPFEDVQEDYVVLKGATLKVSKDTLYYNGEAQYPSYIELKLKGEKTFKKYELTDGQNSEVPAVITYSNNVNKGTATICLTGIKDDKGKVTTIKKTFSIKALDISGSDKVKATVASPATWAVKGAKPVVEVTFDGKTLVEGEDYSVAYKNNTKAPTKGAATAIITGKGNFAKKLTPVAYDIEAFALADARVAGVVAAADMKGSQVKVTLVDPNGDVIPTSKYKITVLDGETDMTKAKLVAEKTYTVKIERKNEKITEITEDAITVDVVAGANLAKASVKLAKGFQKVYTGEAIELTDEDFTNITVTLKIGKTTQTLKYGEDFEIGGYSNNIKKGTMKVTIVGLDSSEHKLSGAKTFNVKIVAKPLKK